MSNKNNIIKTLKNEIKEIKWIPAKDIARQTLFSLGVITLSMAIFMAYDLGIQTLIGMLLK